MPNAFDQFLKDQGIEDSPPSDLNPYVRPLLRGASPLTLVRRAWYRGRKGRAALSRLRRGIPCLLYWDDGTGFEAVVRINSENQIDFDANR